MKRLQWETKISLIRSGLVVKLILITAIPFVAVAVYLYKRYSGQLKGTNGQYALILLGILYFLIVLMIFALNIGKNYLGFILDGESIVTYSHPGSRKSGKFSDFKLAFFGNPRSRHVSSHRGLTSQVMKIYWEDVYKAKYYPKRKLILLCACVDKQLLVFCTKKNYSKIEKTIKKQILLSEMKTQEKKMEDLK